MREYKKYSRNVTSYMKYVSDLDKQGKLTPLQKRQVERFKNLKKNLAVEPKVETNRNSFRDNFRDFTLKREQKIELPPTVIISKSKKVEVPCNLCGKIKYIKPSELKYKWHFCKKVCQDKFYKGKRF